MIQPLFSTVPACIAGSDILLLTILLPARPGVQDWTISGSAGCAASLEASFRVRVSPQAGERPGGPDPETFKGMHI